MPLILKERWMERRWATDHVDASAATGGRPEAGMLAWGVPLRKRWRGEWLGTHSALEGGRRFDLSRDAVLEWRHVAAADLGGAPLEGGMLKERIVLDRAPATGRWEFDLEAPPGCALHLQPPLTAEDIARGHVRPAHVVGSYALFGPSGEKLGHIFRPFAEDAAGERRWLKLAVEPLSPTLTRLAIEAPSAFLASARYPVIIDPTFGYTSIGATSGWDDPDQLYAQGPFSPGSNGTADSISWYLRYYTNGAKATFGLYDTSGGNPSNRVVDTAEGAPGATGAWLTLAADSAAQVYAATQYWIAVHFGAYRSYVYFDEPGADTVKYRGAAYVAGQTPHPFGTPSTYPGRSSSCYVTYTEPAARKAPWHLFLRKAV